MPLGGFGPPPFGNQFLIHSLGSPKFCLRTPGIFLHGFAPHVTCKFTLILALSEDGELLTEFHLGGGGGGGGPNSPPPPPPQDKILDETLIKGHKGEQLHFVYRTSDTNLFRLVEPKVNFELRVLTPSTNLKRSVSKKMIHTIIIHKDIISLYTELMITRSFISKPEEYM